MEYQSYRHIPNALREYRKSRGLSQKEVAAFLGLKDNTLISRWENGDALPNLVNAFKLAKLYNDRVDDLFSNLLNVV